MKKIYLTLLLGIFLFSFASALDSQGTFKQGDCMNISQTCASCSYVNISSVSNQNNSNLVSNVEMVSFGNGEWRYEFCDTNFIGRYDVKGQGDLSGTDTSFATYFEITPDGFTGTLGFYILILILSLGIIILGFAIQDGWVTILGSFGFVLLGLFIILFGIVGLKDAAYTYGIGIITMMVGAYIGIRSAVEQI